MSDIEKEADDYLRNKGAHNVLNDAEWKLCVRCYVDGHEAARLADRKELLDWIDWRIKDLGQVNFDIHCQVLNELKAKLSEGK